nr:hypothetical protein OG781_42345 [Streptomyces sp. NBC_00830]
MTMPHTQAAQITGEALARAVAGDVQGGAELLVPLIADGPRTAYGLAAMLAETASFLARREQQPGTFFATTVEHAVTGEPGGIEELPPEIQFAAQFTTAWANRDQDTAIALFGALVNKAEASEVAELVDGLMALFQMAVATAPAVCVRW